MDLSNPPVINAAAPTYRRWVGVLLSLLIPGAGIFLAGNRKSGLRWFLGLTVLWLVTTALASLPFIPGLTPFVVLAAMVAVLTVWMLVLSFRPVPMLGVRGWLLFLLLTGLLSGAEVLATNRLTLPFKVPSGSMKPTLLPGDRLFVQTSAYWLAAPTRRELVAFRTDALDSPLVPKGLILTKRVAALPGEVVQITGGRLLVNGRPLQDPAVWAVANFDIPGIAFPPGDTNTYVVPAGSYYVVGDNITNSLDSRHYGAVPRQSIIGRATRICWPPARAGDIR
jgi:signal peptidase I